MRIVIVEDEVLIRQGMANLFKRINKDIIIVGEAENGIQGLEIIQKTNPDLIITDIKMPYMDGLEMLTRLHEKNQLGKAIVLSAYSEFAYAQKAIKLGVSEYLVKPIGVSDVIQSLNRIGEEIEQENRVEFGNLKKLKSLENILFGIVQGQLTVDPGLEGFLKNTYHLDIKKDIGLVYVYIGYGSKEKHMSIQKYLQKLLSHNIYGRYCILKMPGNKEILIILYDYINTTKIERYLQVTITRALYKLYKDTIVLGFTVVDKIEQLKDARKELLKCLDWNIVIGKDVMVSYPKITNINTMPLTYPLEIENRAKIALCTYDYEMLQEEITNLFTYFRLELHKPSHIKKAIIRFIWALIHVLKEIDIFRYEELEQEVLLESILSAITVEEIKDILKGFMGELSKNQKNMEVGTSILVQKVQRFVNQFYRQGITLEEVSNNFNVSSEHISTQFTKELGINFSTYIRNLRIKKAKELLIGTDLRLYQIAESIGYNDAKYFSKVFKGVTGMLPTEYRKQNR